MMYECTDRRSVIHVHGPFSGALTSKEAMQRLGVYERPFQVRCYPDGRPDLAHTVQRFEVEEVRKP
jgi:hypothetical protein